jgi:hypothetical protein
LRLELPDRRGWRERSDQGRFDIVEHAPSQSQLAVRVWYESERMDRRTCAEQARSGRSLPELSGADEEPIAVPEGFDTGVRVAVKTAADGARVDGVLLAVGARAKQCFAFVYATSALGPGAERTVADRLAAMRARSLGRAEIERDTDPVPRAPHPALDPTAPMR